MYTSHQKVNRHNDLLIVYFLGRGGHGARLGGLSSEGVLLYSMGIMLHAPHQMLETVFADLAANGVTDIVGETPQDWSVSVRPKAAERVHAVTVPDLSVPIARPQMAKAADPAPKKVAPLNAADFIAISGDVGAPLTILTAILPEQLSAMPFSTREQTLLKNMLRAIGQDLAAVNFGTIIATDDAGVPLTKTQISELHGAAKTALHKLSPQKVLCFGQLAASAFVAGEAMPISACRKAQPQADKLPTVTTYHPKHLLKSPQYKHLAWQDLQPFVTP